MLVRFLRTVLLLICLVCSLPPARAAESNIVTTPHTTVSIVTDTDTPAPGQAFRLGLRFRLNPGWHIYWQNPGDAGQPPTLDLALPQGGSATEIVWPTPQRIGEGPVMTYAYTGEVLLPLTVTLAKGDEAPVIKAAASWLVCEKICVPEEGNFTLGLGLGNGGASIEAPLFTAADAATPVPSPFSAGIAPDGVLSVKGDGLSARNVASAWFFPSQADTIENAASQRLVFRDRTLSLALKPGSAFPKASALDGVLVLQDPTGQQRSLQISATPVAPVAPATTGLGLTLFYAFVGGLILNLMPCVFPVLALKAMSIARLSGAQHGEIRTHAVFYTVGVLASFTALGGILLALRETGDFIGWGFQFQSPAFVAGMAWLVFATGLSLSGVFAIALPVTDGMVGLTDRGGHLGSFSTGVLAVLLATPCTAPFMSIALAVALASPPLATTGIFAALGLGLAAPYAVLAISPSLARVLPRPGRWMIWLKQLLAVPMYGTALWLLWVGSQQTGHDGIVAMVFGLVVVGLGAAAFGLAQRSQGSLRYLGHRSAGLAAIVVAITLWTVSVSAVSSVQTVDTDDGSESFSVEKLAALREAGRPVFVDMTAAWCVTCLVNERVALSTASMRREFSARHIAYLKGDWTRRDPVISQFLQEHDHAGVPLYLLYPAGQGAPEVLPQILSESIIRDAVKRLAG